MPTISRRLASEGTADPSDLRSPSLPGANPGAPTGVWLIGNSRPVRLKPEQPWECKSPHADQFWNVNRTSEPGLGANECVPPGKWCKSTAFRHFWTAARTAETFPSTGFEIERSMDKSQWKLLAAVGADTTTYSDGSVAKRRRTRATPIASAR